MICLATAHPAKFGDTVERAIGRPPELPPSLAGLEGKESRFEVMDSNMEKIMAYIEQHSITSS